MLCVHDQELLFEAALELRLGLARIPTRSYDRLIAAVYTLVLHVYALRRALALLDESLREAHLNTIADQGDSQQADAPDHGMFESRTWLIIADAYIIDGHSCIVTVQHHQSSINITRWHIADTSPHLWSRCTLRSTL